MADLAYLALAGVFFALSYGLIRLCAPGRESR